MNAITDLPNVISEQMAEYYKEYPFLLSEKPKDMMHGVFSALRVSDFGVLYALELMGKDGLYIDIFFSYCKDKENPIDEMYDFLELFDVLPDGIFKRRIALVTVLLGIASDLIIFEIDSLRVPIQYLRKAKEEDLYDYLNAINPRSTSGLYQSGKAFIARLQEKRNINSSDLNNRVKGNANKLISL